MGQGCLPPVPLLLWGGCGHRQTLGDVLHLTVALELAGSVPLFSHCHGFIVSLLCARDCVR
jgi:hypothetical protein